jgi:hypothetical protein
MASALKQNLLDPAEKLLALFFESRAIVGGRMKKISTSEKAEINLIFSPFETILRI